MVLLTSFKLFRAAGLWPCCVGAPEEELCLDKPAAFPDVDFEDDDVEGDDVQGDLADDDVNAAASREGMRLTTNNGCKRL